MKLISPHDKFTVFGSSGMAGSAISRSLQENGYLNQFNPSHSELDLLSYSDVDQWLSSQRPDVVILAAAKVGGILANSTYPADFLIENLKIQLNVIDSSLKHGVRRLLFLGSSCIYPKYSSQPIKEESLLTGPLEPTNDAYALAKIAGIKLCESLFKQYNFDAITLMPTNLYGPGDNYHPTNSHVLPALIRRFTEAKANDLASVTCWGTGSVLREFLHVDDLGSASVFALENWSPGLPNAPLDDHGTLLHHLNVGTGSDIMIRDLAYLVASKVGYKGEIVWDTTKPDGTPKKQLNIDRLTRLGWSPKISLSCGLDQCIQLFQTVWADPSSDMYKSLRL